MSPRRNWTVAARLSLGFGLMIVFMAVIGAAALWALDSSPAGFQWLDADDNHGSTLSYVRYADAAREGDAVVTVVNFSGSAHEGFRVGVPRAGQWRVALDTSGFDAAGTPSQAELVE